MTLIEGVAIKELKLEIDERGRLAEILRADDPMFRRFGQVYFTTAQPGVVKAWHYHKLQHDYFCTIKGMTKLVLYDPRAGSPTNGMINEYFMGEHKLLVVSIPPLVFHGFKTISRDEAIVINIPTEPFNHNSPDEYRLDPHTSEIPYDWSRKDY